ncbi:MAG TPA: cysteine synthase family protein [Thermoanaerobaculia bacterium]|nr:cysteine synthase family protein [Thermoanaerobaculia bacterium]
MRRYETLLDLMRDSPLVAIPARLDGPPHAQLWAQLELALPGAMKDRPALRIVEEAEADGTLRPGGVIVESSSGTMAEGLARVGALKGYRVIIVTDPRIDTMTAAKLRALGAELEVVDTYDPSGGWQSSRLRRLREVLDSVPGAFWSRQYDNPGNAGAYQPLAQELVDALGGDIAALVGSVGSGGSLCGLARALKALLPGVRVVAVDAVGSVLFHQPDRKRLQSGHGNSIVPGNLDHRVLDEVHWIADGEAFNGCRELARKAGIFGGGSSGAVYVAASWVAAGFPAGRHVVAVFPDRGDRYYQNVYSDEFFDKHGLTGQSAAAQPVCIRYGEEVAERWSYAEIPHDGSVSYHTPGAKPTAELSRELGLDSPEQG